MQNDKTPKNSNIDKIKQTGIVSRDAIKKFINENLLKQKSSSENIKEELESVKSIIQSKNYDAHDLRFMSSLSEAILAKAPTASRKILYMIAITFLWLLIWASQAEIDEITRGSGKIIPSGKNQIVQNLEGGIIEEILVRLGDEVKKNQVLLKIDNKNFVSSYGESKLRLDELQAR